MKLAGIIGGVGPLATADFFEKIIKNTPSKVDQDNIPIIIYNNPQIPDRTTSILAGGESPVESIVKTGKALEKMGVDYLAIPCNTSFYYYDQIVEKLNVPLLNMIDLTVEYIKKSELKNVCILGTAGTLKTRLYQDKLDKENINYTDVDDEMIDQLQYVIYKVVKNNDFSADISKFIEKINDLRDNQNVDAFILACTELPVLFERFNIEVNTIDPTLILAKACVDYSLGRKEI